MDKPQLFICSCFSHEHQYIFTYDQEDNMIYVHPHLIYRGFWRRLWVAIRYVFGYKCRFGAWDEFILDVDDVSRLKMLLDKVIPHKQYLAKVNSGQIKLETFKPKMTLKQRFGNIFKNK